MKFLLNIVSSRKGGRNFRGWEKNCHCTFLHVLHPITNNCFVTVFFDVVFQILTLYGMSSLETPDIAPENELLDLATA